DGRRPPLEWLGIALPPQFPYHTPYYVRNNLRTAWRAWTWRASRSPRSTLVTCRTGPRSSALVYLYAGLRSGATADEVLARGEADDAPFVQSEDLKAWIVQGLNELS